MEFIRPVRKTPVLTRRTPSPVPTQPADLGPPIRPARVATPMQLSFNFRPR